MPRQYLGAATTIGSVTSLVLYLGWAGPDVGWTSGTDLGLLAAVVVIAALFVLVESRASEPIVQLQLFRSWMFVSNISFAMVMGVAMFGGLIYLPIYLQAVKGMSATESGLAMLPLVLGIFSTSISGGRIMSRTGRYKWMPIAGAIVVGIAFVGLSRIAVETGYRAQAGAAARVAAARHQLVPSGRPRRSCHRPRRVPYESATVPHQGPPD